MKRASFIKRIVNDAMTLSPPGTEPGLLCLGTSHFNLVTERSAIVRNLILIVVLMLCCLLSLSTGTLYVSPLTVMKTLLGQGDAMTQFLIFDLRLNRILAGVYTGAAFSLAGCLMQTVARNRLATPGIIGLDNAAMAFAVASVTGVGFGLAPSAMALTGAATATALAFAIGGGQRHTRLPLYCGRNGHRSRFRCGVPALTVDGSY